MIKRLIGILIAVAVVVVIIISAVRRDNFKSMELRDGIMNQDFPEAVVPEEYLKADANPAPEPIVSDSVSVTATVTDSLP